MEDAERIKKRYGCALGSLVTEDDPIEVPTVGGRAPKILSKHELTNILEPRAAEIAKLVYRDIEKVGLLCQTPGDEPDAERHCASLELGGLLLQPRSFAVAAAENSKTARAADRARETCAGNHIHWGREDRILDAQKR